MFFMEGTQKKMKLSRKVITHPLIDRNVFNPIFNTKVVLRASLLFCSVHCFACDYLQAGFSEMLDISYLFNNNTLKCIKAKIFPFNQK
jgi:hypothetical protein